MGKVIMTLGMADSKLTLKTPWRLGLGAHWEAGKTSFCVWAPKCKQIEVAVQDNNQFFPLQKMENGYFVGEVPLQPGTLYRYRIDGDKQFPDPCSRFQPEGPHGPSMIVDPYRYQWHDQEWKGVTMKGQVIYELHIGAFTAEGTFDAAAKELKELKRLGVTLIEVMPVAEFPGRWNLGYDGVDLFAPAHVYGDYDALKRFVDQAHCLGLGVILDVVYNHFGPDGNYTAQYSPYYLSEKYTTDWGDVINFDGIGSKEVREFFISNACYWIQEFHLDGLRLDSTHDLYDEGVKHILAELSERTREVASPRQIILVAENEPQDIKLIRPYKEHGYGLDGVWNDDFHHAAIVALTGRSEAYYTDYKGTAQEFISLYKRAYLYQGQAYSWQGRARGTIVQSETAWSFIFYLQNHDQISNELRGERIHFLTDRARLRALTALLLLAPETPLIFMGQEFASSKPFLFFADHTSEVLIKNITEGRRKFLEQFPSFASAYHSPEGHRFLPDVFSPNSFERSKLDFSEREKNADIYRMHYDLLRIRREDPTISMQDRFAIDGAVLDTYVFAIRYFGERGNDRLLIVNLGRDFEYNPIPEPLLAPSHRGDWELMWSSDDPSYGGPGIIPANQESGWILSAQSAHLFRSVSEEDKPLMEKKIKVNNSS
jgi:maltooligosyltrehalose trehalohydrolase